MKRSKIINDPVHGFIDVPRGVLLNLIDDPAFQRLRRIKQLGLSSMVYPGAVHTRFNHALGAMHLMRQALDALKRKKVKISKQEYKAALIAILLHDIGHGPFSHALEYAIIPNLHHEDMSLALMHYLNKKHKGKLDLAIEIFEGNYERTFLHQLVSSQLDMDRMDYLIRDSFFTGVAEGVVGIDRIIKILTVANNQLVCEDKGIYSIEKFIVSRRLMYWQVYLHKAAVAAENMMLNILRRARELVNQGENIYLDENLGYFFHHPVSHENLSDEVIERFIRLDDNDIEHAIKKWQYDKDFVLSNLCKRILSRNLLKVQFVNETPDSELVRKKKEAFAKKAGISVEEAAYFVFSDTVHNQAYLEGSKEPIRILFRNGDIQDLATVTDTQSIHALAQPVVKAFFCFPDEVR
ncbi:MAG: HD domain-containing protein [Bacteroidetes bacterium]|nr:HD domain-containing protein [Bacteroidota bacterium]MCB0846103.1 HD domain-containing protein [Bacteroidota bacterium]